MLAFSIRWRVGEELRLSWGGGGRPESAFGGGEREINGGEKVDERETEEL